MSRSRKMERLTRRGLQGACVFTCLLLACFVWRAVVLCRVALLTRVDSGDISFVHKCLRSNSELVRLATAKKLGIIGTPAEAIPDLLDILENDSWEVASDAAWSLGRLEPPTPEVIAGLRRALNHEHREVRRYAAYSLARHGAQSREAIPRLRELLKDDHVGYMAARALGTIGVEARVAIADLVDLCESPDFGKRYEAVLSLGKLGPLPPEGIAAIKRCSDDEQEIVRYAAKEALKYVCEWSQTN